MANQVRWSRESFKPDQPGYELSDESDPQSASAPLEEAPPRLGSVDELWQEAYREQFHLRFSTRELLIAMAVSAAVLALGRLIPTSIAAMLAGGTVVLGIVFLSVNKPAPRLAQLIFWVLLLTYLSLAMIASVEVVRQGRRAAGVPPAAHPETLHT